MVRICNLTKTYVKRSFFGAKTTLSALDDVSIDIAEGTSLGVVGESGCGKSTLALSALRLINPDSGSVTIGGTDIASLSADKLRRFRRSMRIVLQDSWGSLNPRIRCESLVAEPFHIFEPGMTKREIAAHTEALFSEVGLGGEHLRRYPHELSGGQRQRVNIARAMALNPSFVVFDEPVSSLDVSVQAQVLNLINELKRKHRMTSIMISHNLAVVSSSCEHIAVMYLGRIAEWGPAGKILSAPLHPYSRILLSAALGKGSPLTGDVPSPVNPPAGCRFHTRCPEAMPVCSAARPVEADIDGVRVACHLYR